MFLEHFAVALAAKRAAPELSLGTLFLAAQLADLVWPMLTLAGIERFEIRPGDTAVTPAYVTGLSPERELPIIAKIAVGSLRNKLLFLLPAETSHDLGLKGLRLMHRLGLLGLLKPRIAEYPVAAFGLHSPPRLEPERQQTDGQLARALAKIRTDRPRASLTYVWSPPPDTFARAELDRAIQLFPKRQTDLCWISMDHDPSVARDQGALAQAVAEAVAIRVRVARARGERALRRLGVRVLRIRASAPLPDAEASREA